MTSLIERDRPGDEIVVTEAMVVAGTLALHGRFCEVSEASEASEAGEKQAVREFLLLWLGWQKLFSQLEKLQPKIHNFPPCFCPFVNIDWHHIVI